MKILSYFLPNNLPQNLIKSIPDVRLSFLISISEQNLKREVSFYPAK
jgi:hypothetical protein